MRGVNEFEDDDWQGSRYDVYPVERDEVITSLTKSSAVEKDEEPESEETNTIRVEVNENLSKKLKYLSAYDFEIGGWLVGELKNKVYYLDDVIIPPQEVSGGETEQNGDSISWILQKHPKQVKRILGHWHSHNTMGAFFSAGDHSNHKVIMNGKKLFLFLVTSSRVGGEDKKGKDYSYKGCVLLKEPFEIELDITIYEDEEDDDSPFRRQLDKEVKDKVKVTTYNYGSGGYGYSYGGKTYYPTQTTTNKLQEEALKNVKARCEKAGRMDLWDKINNRVSSKVEDNSEMFREGDHQAWIIECNDITGNEMAEVKEIMNCHEGWRRLLIQSEVVGTDLFRISIDCKRKKTKKKLMASLIRKFPNLEID